MIPPSDQSPSLEELIETQPIDAPGFEPYFMDTPIALILECVRRGFKVVRLYADNKALLTIGHMESKWLEASGLRFEWAAGVSSIETMQSYLGLPIEDADHQGVHIIDAHHPISSALYQAIVQAGGTWYIQNAAAVLPELVIGFQKAGMVSTTPAMMVAHPGTAHQRYIETTIGQMTDLCVSENMPEDSILMLGRYATTQHQIHWWPAVGPLSGMTVCLLATHIKEHNQDELAAGIDELGGSLKMLEWIKTITEGKTEQQLDASLKSYIDRLDAMANDRGNIWFVFFSISGVEAFIQSLYRLKYDFRQFKHVKFAVLNQRVKRALQSYGLKADFIGLDDEKNDDGDEDVFAHLLVDQTEKDDQIIAIRGSRPLLGVSMIMNMANRSFYEWTGYETMPLNMKRDDLLSTLDQINMLIFTGAGTALTFANALAEVGLGAKDLLDRRIQILAQGTVVKRTLERTGLYCTQFCRIYGHEALLEYLNELRL